MLCAMQCSVHAHVCARMHIDRARPIRARVGGRAARGLVSRALCAVRSDLF